MFLSESVNRNKRDIKGSEQKEWRYNRTRRASSKARKVDLSLSFPHFPFETKYVSRSWLSYLIFSEIFDSSLSLI
jgi:hypothetical protein